MSDRPIIFSAPMVRALLAGRKTQTRRLASSPLRRCVIGDRLYVRENFTYMPGRDVELPVMAADYPQPDLARLENVPTYDQMRWTPCIHTPRRHSRLTLVVEAVRAEPLQAISGSDARAEGLSRADKAGSHWKWGIPDRDGWPGTDDEGWPWQRWRSDPRDAFAQLWGKLHSNEGERWEDNPNVVALTFRVIFRNIDQVPA